MILPRRIFLTVFTVVSNLSTSSYNNTKHLQDSSNIRGILRCEVHVLITDNQIGTALYVDWEDGFGGSWLRDQKKEEREIQTRNQHIE